MDHDAAGSYDNLNELLLSAVSQAGLEIRIAYGCETVWSNSFSLLVLIIDFLKLF